MKIYAIRDRLLNYFMQPFAGPEDKAVLAAIARTINTGDPTSDIVQAPHHFEVWRLAKVTEDGHIEEDRELIADAASLIRPGVRTNRITEGGETTATVGQRSGPMGGPEARTHTDPGPLPSQTPATAGTA